MKSLPKLIISAVAAIIFGVAPALAQYPEKPIKMVVGFAAGGFTDVLARVIGQKLNERLGKPVIVGASAVATAIPVVANTANDTTTSRLYRIMLASLRSPSPGAAPQGERPARPELGLAR